jgi:hypothetical protein
VGSELLFRLAESFVVFLLPEEVGSDESEQQGRKMKIFPGGRKRIFSKLDEKDESEQSTTSNI